MGVFRTLALGNRKEVWNVIYCRLSGYLEA
jgi:hypothetical protein